MSLCLTDVASASLATSVRYPRDRPTPMSLIGLWHLGGGAASRVAAAATAFGRWTAPTGSASTRPAATPQTVIVASPGPARPGPTCTASPTAGSTQTSPASGRKRRRGSALPTAPTTTAESPRLKGWPRLRVARAHGPRLAQGWPGLNRTAPPRLAATAAKVVDERTNGAQDPLRPGQPVPHEPEPPAPRLTRWVHPPERARASHAFPPGRERRDGIDL